MGNYQQNLCLSRLQQVPHHQPVAVAAECLAGLRDLKRLYSSNSKHTNTQMSGNAIKWIIYANKKIVFHLHYQKWGLATSYIFHFLRRENTRNFFFQFHDSNLVGNPSQKRNNTDFYLWRSRQVLELCKLLGWLLLCGGDEFDVIWLDRTLTISSHTLNFLWGGIRVSWIRFLFRWDPELLNQISFKGGIRGLEKIFFFDFSSQEL